MKNENENMSEQDYRKARGLNYSAMSMFFQSQDHALLPFKHKSYFEDGKIFESLLQDSCIGTSTFESRYFICDIDGAMPDDIISLIESGADLNNEYIYKKDGCSLNNTYKKKHAFLNACLANEKGLFPVQKWKRERLYKMVDNMLKMPLFGATVFDILSKALWQVPVFWEKDGIKKKALFDCVLLLDGETYLFDVKTGANEYQLSKMVHSKYWLQEIHYSEGAEAEWGNVKSFTFLASFKEEPFLSQSITIEGDKQEQYETLCKNYIQWLKDDKPKLGYLPEKTIRLRNY